MAWFLNMNFPAARYSYLYLLQRIQYAKTKSDCIAKVDGTFVAREKKKQREEKGNHFIS